MSDSSLEATMMVAIASGFSLLLGSLVWVVATIGTAL